MTFEKRGRWRSRPIDCDEYDLTILSEVLCATMGLTLLYPTDRGLRSFAGGETSLPILLNLPLTRFLKERGHKERGQKGRFPIWFKRRKGPA